MKQVIAKEALLEVAARHGLPSASKRLAAMSNSLRDDLVQLEGRLVSLLDGQHGPVEDAVRHLLDSGGKRMRPLLCLLAHRAFRAVPMRTVMLTLAQVGELVHAASLMHDDVIDLGELRRGRPTARMVYGNAASVLGGDLLLVQAFSLTHSTEVPHLLTRLLEVLQRMIAAESMQLARRGRTNVSVEDCFEIISGKTAALFEWSVEAGARAARADESSVRALRLFGHEIGMAFQLVDDVLDLRKDPSSVGKSVLQDIQAGTMTYPVIRAARVQEGLGELLMAATELSGEEEDLGREILDLIRTGGGIESTLKEITHRTERARQALTALPESLVRSALDATAVELAARTR
jgi:octaprenyl-diphosphate synthase